MPNMSYCRFENTATDLQDCVDAINSERCLRDEGLDKYERKGLQRILHLAKEIVKEEEYIRRLITHDHEPWNKPWNNPQHQER